MGDSLNFIMHSNFSHNLCRIRGILYLVQNTNVLIYQIYLYIFYIKDGKFYIFIYLNKFTPKNKFHFLSHFYII